MIADVVIDERDDDVVVLVDRTNSVLGVAPKLDAHRDGRLHRAVSVVLFDQDGRVLLQQRATVKYHSGGLWSNTCCGHPRPGETATEAGYRCLTRELGIEECGLTPVSEFVYYADVDGGLVEHELDQVLIGCWTGQPKPDPHEVSATRWVEPDTLFADLAARPRTYTVWTHQVLSHACIHRKALESG